MIPSDTHPPKNFDSGRLSHAYITPGSFAEMLAMATVCSGAGTKPCTVCAHCVKAINGLHPDIITVGRQENKREILIEQIRELKRDVIIVPNEAEKKAYIINDADSMNINAQNAFLQILEEPPRHVVFILKSEIPDKLLPTVRSRCVEIKTAGDEDTLETSAIEISDDFFDALRQGNASLVAFMFRLEKLEKEQFSAFLATSRKQAAEELKTAVISGDISLCERLSHAETILSKASQFLDLNVGLGHISGLICAGVLTDCAESRLRV